MPSNGPIGVAVVGAGYWGAKLVRTFSALDGCRLLRVVDVDPARLEAIRQAHPGLDTSPLLSDLIGDKEVEAVVVATPAEAHCEVAIRVLSSGRHVFVEKPLATSLRDGQAMYAAARNSGRILMVGHLFLHDPAVRSAIDLVRAGAIGDLRYLTSVRASMSGTARLDTSITWDSLIHDAYVLPAIVGRPPTRIRAAGGAYLSQLDDVVFAEFDFGEGILASCQATWYGLQKERRLVAVGSKAIIEIDGLRPQPLVVHRRRYAESEFQDSQGRRRWQWHDDGSEVFHVASHEPLQLECADFIACIREGHQPTEGGSEGIAAIRIIQACQESLEHDGSWARVRFSD